MSGSDALDAVPQTTTLIAQLLDPGVLKALGLERRDVARGAGVDEGSLRRLIRGEGVRNKTAAALLIYFNRLHRRSSDTSSTLGVRDLFDERHQDEVLAAVDRYLELRGRKR